MVKMFGRERKEEKSVKRRDKRKEIEGEKIGGCEECSVWSYDAGENIESVCGE